MATALLLDVGHVILEPSWRAVRAYESATGTAMPLADEIELPSDDRWRETSSGDEVGDRYWDEVARRAGLDGIVGMFRAFGTVVPDAMFNRDAVVLMDDARAAGMPVGILTNHAHMILGPDWFAARPEFAGLAAFIDAAEVGVPKPDPQAYLLASEALGVAPADVVFLDDTPACADGATAVGMTGIVVDPRDRRPAFDEARRLLGLA